MQCDQRWLSSPDIVDYSGPIGPKVIQMLLNRAIAVIGDICRCLGNDASQLYVSDFEQFTRRDSSHITSFGK